jgi:phosphoribosylaminoimidazole (AIR) synthetase
MRRTFNLGIGMVIVVPASSAAAALAILDGTSPRVIGSLVPRAGGAPSRFVGD